MRDNDYILYLQRCVDVLNFIEEGSASLDSLKRDLNWVVFFKHDVSPSEAVMEWLRC